MEKNNRVQTIEQARAFVNANDVTFRSHGWGIALFGSVVMRGWGANINALITRRVPGADYDQLISCLRGKGWDITNVYDSKELNTRSVKMKKEELFVDATFKMI